VGTTEKVEALKNWLEEVMECRVDFHRDWASDTYFFWAHLRVLGGGPRLRVTEVAFEDNSVEQIISDLDREEVPQWLTYRPDVWPLYNNTRQVQFSETRWVQFEGKNYRFVRDRERHVRVYHESEELLPNLFSPLSPLPGSIFLRKEWDLIEHLRQ
jgi:hypothetical protein